ncbi:MULTISPECIES: helix-turn-helix domain-containing protein [Actinomadura]|uniref:Scr1 family TA system antitoxin-like transcriptional regulator n=1 Tax=Actinomadura yumaensis TaxID=111807 RepID=A0ABW2CUN5_9ACTN|nr:Scr1 family TA system antitoxin-like transcriptional regulator [Actinomadura sp. J1-007]
MPIDPRASMKAQLSFTLRMMREMKGLSQDRLAKELYTTRETIAAYESGRNRPDETFCKMLDEFFGTGELFQGLWHHAQREHLNEWFEAYVAHENEATEIRTFQPLYIPGLLQTEGYMRANALPHTRVEEGIARRLARREALVRDNDPPHFFAVLDQAVIVRPVGGREVMREQLQYLLERSELPRVHLQIIKFSQGWYYGLHGPIVVLSKADRSRVGYAEAQFGGRLIQNPPEVIRAGLRFDELRGRALSENASRSLIRQTMEEMRDDPVAEE